MRGSSSLTIETLDTSTASKSIFPCPLNSCTVKDGIHDSRDNHSQASKVKIGSLQVFADNLGPIENFSSDIFDRDEVHKIAILDLRLFNLDRNLSNILVTCPKGEEGNFEEYKLVPIDHGLSIPDTLGVNSYELAWLSFE